MVIAREAATDIDRRELHARLPDRVAAALQRGLIGARMEALRADVEREGGACASLDDALQEVRTVVDARAELARKFDQRAVRGDGDADVEPQAARDGAIVVGAGLAQQRVELVRAVEREVAHAVFAIGVACGAADADGRHEARLGVRITSANEFNLGQRGDVEMADVGAVDAVNDRQGVVRLHRIHRFAGETFDERFRGVVESRRQDRVNRQSRPLALDQSRDRGKAR